MKVYNIHDIAGIRLLTKLRSKFSALNEHTSLGIMLNVWTLSVLVAQVKKITSTLSCIGLSLNFSAQISLVNSGTFLVLIL